MSFDLEISVQPARLSPYGMHCGTSWPDGGFPCMYCSEVEVLACYSAWIYYLTYMPGLKTLPLLPTVFTFQFSSLLCFRFFSSPSVFSHRILYIRGVKLIFTGGHIHLMVAFKEPNVILGLYKCNYSLTRGKELRNKVPGRNKVPSG